MEVKINDKELLDTLISKLISSKPFQERFDKIIREQIKIYANEFFEMGYKKGLKENNNGII